MIEHEIQLLTAQEIAKTLKISLAYAYQLMRTGQIRTVRIGRSVRVRASDLIEYIELNVDNRIESC